MNHFTTPQEAEQVFYTAFQNRDIQMMKAVWLDASHIVCIHPMGMRLSGREEVLTSWRQIFSSPTILNLIVAGAHTQQSDDLAIHMLDERITSKAQPDKPTIVVTTNIYQKVKDNWYLILHHASLSAQTAVERADMNIEKTQTSTMLH